MKTQETMILEHLQSGKSISPLEALNRYGIFRLASVVFNLKKQGHVIITHIVKAGKKRFASYELGTLHDLFKQEG